MNQSETSISLQGKQIKVAEYLIDNKNIVIKGKLLKIARLKVEWYDDIENPEKIINGLRENGSKADIFTFMQRLPEMKPKYDYFVRWDNAAAIPIESYDKWFNTQVKRQARNKIKKSIKLGVVVKEIDFNDDFVKDLAKILNETPIRQGRPYWHYGKDLETIKREHITFIEDSIFLGAYFQNELIGFLKLVILKKFARSLGIIAMNKHRDKAALNALIDRAVKICADRKIPFLMYDKAFYGNRKESTLYDFKRYNGYQKFDLPRYFIPLTLKGKIAIWLRLFRRLNEYFPRFILYFLYDMRVQYYTFKYRKFLKQDHSMSSMEN